MPLVRLLSLFATLFGCLLVASGCTRSLESSSKLHIAPPARQIQNVNKVGTLSTATLAHLVINVREAGSQQIAAKLSWDNKCEQESSTTTCPAPPESFSVEVFQGINYLIQVIAVYYSEEGGLDFKYGDAFKIPEASVESVDIFIASIGSSNGVETRVGGRYLTAANSGPTGTLVMNYKPPLDRPPVEILQSTIFNGWFSVFSIQGAPFDYVVRETGETLFKDADASDANQPQFAESPYRMRVFVPDSYRWDYDNSSWRLENGGEVLYGYFGPYVASNTADYKVCFDEVDEAYDNVYIDAGVTPLNFDGLSPYNSTSIHPSGLGGDGSTGCPFGPEPNKLRLNHQYFDGWIGSFFGFESAYVYQDLGDHRALIRFIDGWTSGDQANVVAQWNYLPAVKGNGVDSSTAFLLKQNQADGYRLDNAYDCRRLYNESKPFSDISQMPPVTRFDADTETSTDGHATVKLPLQWLQAQDAEIILCPYQGTGSVRHYFKAGKRSHGLHFDFPTQTLDLKVVGSGTAAENSVYGAVSGLGQANLSFLKANMVGGSNPIHLLPFAANDMYMDQYIDSSHISLVEMSFDNGSSWINLSTNCSGDLIDHTDSNGRNMLLIRLNTLQFCSSVSGDWGTTSDDIQVKFRVTVEPNYQHHYGLGSGLGNVYTSGILTFLGDTHCSGYTVTAVKTAAPTTEVPTGNFMDEFFIPTGSDVSTEYQLAWLDSGSNVCTDPLNGSRSVHPIMNELSYINPPGCFGEWEIRHDGSNPFSFIIDPTDPTVLDCDLNGSTLTFVAAGESAQSYAASFTTGDIIGHSTVASKLLPLLSADTSAASLGDHKLVVERIFAPSGLNLGILSIFANQDYRPTDGSIPSTVNWATDGTWSTGGTKTNPSLLTVGNPSSSAMEPKKVVFNESGKGGHFEILAHNLTNEDIVFVGRDPFRGGSPLIVTRDGLSQGRIYYVPNPEYNYGFAGLRLLHGPTPISFSFPQARHYYIPEDNYEYIVFNSSISGLTYLALGHDDQVAAISEIPNINGTYKIWDFKRMFDGAGDFLLVVTEEGANDGHLFYFPLSTFDGSSWTHPTSIDDQITNEAGRIVDCGGSLYLHGIWNANYAALIPFDVSINDIVADPTSHSLGGDGTNYWFGEYTNFECTNISGENHFLAYRANATAQMPSAGRLPLIFKGYQEGTSSAFTEILFTDSSVYIDAMTYMSIGGQLRLVAVIRPVDTNLPIEIRSYVANAADAPYELDAVIGSLPNNAGSMINGLREFWDHIGRHYLYLYGTDGQLYMLRVE